MNDPTNKVALGALYVLATVLVALIIAEVTLDVLKVAADPTIQDAIRVLVGVVIVGLVGGHTAIVNQISRENGEYKRRERGENDSDAV